MRGTTVLGLLVGLAMVLVACGGGSADDDSTAPTDSTISITSSTQAVDASTTSLATATTGSTSVRDDPTTTESTATSSTTTPSSTAQSSTTRSSTTSDAPTTTEILVVDGGFHEFASPSGNIACVMSELSASCWISEKSWTIEQPSAPECEESDWGNAVDLSADGPSFPCYNDFGWNPSAPAMPYGTSVQLGPFRCDSAKTGVTCTNASGNGFTVAKAAVDLF